MRINEIKERVLSGELVLVKTPVGIKRTRRYIFDKDGNITGFKKFEYQGFVCRAEYPDNHSGYRISKKIFNELVYEKE